MKTQWVIFKNREKVFALTLVAILCIGIGAWLGMVVTWKESYMNYFLVRNQLECKWIGFKYIAILSYIVIEAVILTDDVCNFMVNVAILYLSGMSMNFWLHKIWLVDSALHFTTFR